jgi:hypothetical protein
VRSLLADIKYIKDSHSSENIAKAIIPIFKEMISIERLEFFISDNASPNNIIIRAILVYLRSNLKDSDSRRVRYLRHIINLTAKAFLFRKDADAFKEES